MTRLAAAMLLVSATAYGDPPTLKPSEVVAKTAAALVRIDPKAPLGAGTELFLIDKANVAVDGKAIRAELGKQGLTLLEERELAGTIAFTVQAKSGARATIAIGPDRGRVVATMRPTTIVPPGACTAIPNVEHHVVLHGHGVNDRGESFESDTRWHLDTARLLDVDGDGLLDAFVPVVPNKDACPELVSYRVFVVRGNCGHEVGTVGPGSLAYDAATIPLAASGFRPIVTAADSSKRGNRGVPDRITTTRRFEVAGGRYKQVDIKSSGGICHHCAVWFCNKE